MQRWERLLDRLGFPTAIIVVATFGAWRLASWASPKADALIETHLRFIEKVSTTQEVVVSNQARIISAIESNGKLLNEMNARLK